MRTPTIPEIAEKLDITEVDVHEAMEVRHAYHPMPIHASVASNKEEQHMLLEDLLGVEDSNIRNIRYAEYRMDIEKAMCALNKREQKIIRDRYYLDLSQTDIAMQLGMSQAHVSRLLNHGLRELEVILRS